MKWRKGPPPEIGWWPASTSQDPECLRWWNGKCWSLPVYSWQSKEQAGQFALIPSDFKTMIWWTDRWWL